MGRDLGRVPERGGGEEREGLLGVWLWACPGEVRAEPPCG